MPSLEKLLCVHLVQDIILNEMKKAVCFGGVIFSGNANNSANAGLAYSNTNNTPSNTNANISSQLCNFFESKGRASWQKMTLCLTGISRFFRKFPLKQQTI